MRTTDGTAGRLGRALWQRALLTPLLRAGFGLDVRAEVDLAGLAAPCIFAANHRSHLDTLAVLAALPAPLRARTRIAAAEDYWYRSALRRAAAAAINAFPFPRAGTAGLDRAAALLAAGGAVLLYPAGTREPGREFKRGVGVLAARTGCPVVPIAILGTAAAWPKGRLLPRRGKVAVRFGAPLMATPGESPAALTARVAAEVARLSTVGIAGEVRPTPGITSKRAA